MCASVRGGVWVCACVECKGGLGKKGRCSAKGWLKGRAQGPWMLPTQQAGGSDAAGRLTHAHTLTLTHSHSQSHTLSRSHLSLCPAPLMSQPGCQWNQQAAADPGDLCSRNGCGGGVGGSVCCATAPPSPRCCADVSHNCCLSLTPSLSLSLTHLPSAAPP